MARRAHRREVPRRTVHSRFRLVPRRLQEKQYNLAINVWVRAPALVATAVLAMIQVHVQNGVPGWVSTVRVALMVLAVWNGLFFMERVVGNYHVCAYKAKLEQEASKGKEGKGAVYDEIYTTEEHLSGIVPGIGVRTSVSSHDLQLLNGSGESWSSAPKAATHVSAMATNAYPVEGGKKVD